MSNKSYIVKENNLTLIDPSGAIRDDSVNHEDLNVYVKLIARVKNKSLVTYKPDQSVYEYNFIKQTAVDGKNTSTSITEPSGKRFLTTDWTQIGSLDSKLGEDLETFGITSIDISFNSGFIPQIVINFVDIRGATLFEQGTCSPYAAFFHQPYPIFELTVKGFYGYPIKYSLAIQKFNTKFNAQTGNYESTAEFIGYSYAFLSDILIGYVLAGPYMEGSDEKLTKIYEKYLKYYEDNGLNTENKFNPINGKGKPMTLYNYIKKIESLESGSNGQSESVLDQIRSSKELNALSELESIDNYLNDEISGALDFFVGEWEDLGGTVDDKNREIVSYSFTEKDDKYDDLVSKYNEYFKEQGIIDTKVDYFNEIVNENIGDSSLLMSNDLVELVEDDDKITVSLKEIKTELTTKSGDVSKKTVEYRKEFTKQVNNLIKKEIGFLPTIRSFFTVLLANTELFLTLLKDTSAEAEKYHESAPTDEVIKLPSNSKVEKPVSDIVYAWPTYMVEKQNPTVVTEEYPGENARFRRWPEITFVENFIDALQEMNEDISNPDGDESGAKYENRVGYDNYVAINAMESPSAVVDANISYYKASKKSSLDVYKTIGERFITLTNMSSLHSNHLNSSLITYARNEYQKKINEGFFTISNDNTFTHLEEGFKGNTAPFVSMGIPFNPEKFGGEDNFYDDSLTYDSIEQKEITNLKNYPTVLLGPDNFKSNGGTLKYPMGVDGTKEIEGISFNKSTISEKYKSIYNYWGRVEGFNFLSSVDTPNILSSIVTNVDSDNPGALVNKIVEALGFSFESDDFYYGGEGDIVPSGFRYNEDIVLNPLSDGGNVTLKPNIHDMDVDSLIKIRECTTCTGINDKKPGFPQIGVRDLDLKEDNPIINVFNETLSENYNIDFKKATYLNFDKVRRDMNLSQGLYPDLSLNTNSWLSNGLSLTKGNSYFKSFWAYGDKSKTAKLNEKGKFVSGVYSKRSPYSQINNNIVDTMLEAEIYPDLRLNYDLGQSSDFSTWEKFKGVSQENNKGDLNWRYSLGIHEFTGNGYRDLKIGSRHLQSGWFTILPSYYNDGTNEETFSYTPTEGTIKLKANLYGTPKWTEMKVIDYSPASINGEGGFIEVESLLKNANRSTSGVKTQIINNTQTTNDSNRYKIQEGVQNLNQINHGNTLIETPFWRHNFPSKDVESNTNSHYYTMMGCPHQFIEGANGNLKLSSSRFFVGVKTDLDKGLGEFIGFRPKNNSNIGSTEKINMLTTHNKNVFNINNTGSGTNPTNLNRTKLWKGALAYMFLANQLHRPWTGMYTNNNSWYGPQSNMGTASITAVVPKQSLLLLGAVLWRMRESGLLISDDETWNLPPKSSFINVNGDQINVDPINVPLLPENLKYETGGDLKYLFNTKHFGWDIDTTIVSEDIKNGTYNWNNGVRPPMASLLVNINGNDDILGTICFPRADEWPTPNIGMINAISLFKERDGVENPFKNQYDIFAPILSQKGSSNLRFANQSVRWLATKENVDQFTENLSEIQNEFEKAIGSYGTAAQEKYKAKQNEEISKKIEKENPTGTVLLEDILDSVTNLATKEESYSKMSFIYHDLGSDGLYTHTLDDGATPYPKNLGRSVKGTDDEIPEEEIITVKTLEELEQIVSTGQYLGIPATIVKEVGASKRQYDFCNKKYSAAKALSTGSKADDSVFDLLTRITIPAYWQNSGKDTDFNDGSGKPFDINKYKKGGCREGLTIDEINGFNETLSGGDDDANKIVGIFSNTVLPISGDTRRFLYSFIRYSDTKNANPELRSTSLGTIKSIGNNTIGYRGVIKGRRFVIKYDKTKIVKLDSKKTLGYLHGYLPLGPEIWFLPTKIKETIIKEFETFVGDFNNFSGSEFDKMLEIIDPLNFPIPTIDRKEGIGDGVLEGSITTPFLDSLSGIDNNGNQIPFPIIKDPRTVGAAGQELLDIDTGTPANPTEITRWINTYNTTISQKDAFIGGNREIQLLYREIANNQERPLVNEVYEKLFNDGYVLTTATPRIWWGEFPLEKDGDNYKHSPIDNFLFNEQELRYFAEGFITSLKDEYSKKIQDDIEDAEKEDRDAGDQDKDLRLATYRSLKSIYDRWISASPPSGEGDNEDELFYNTIGPGRLLIDHFSFVNRVNADIGDKAIINTEQLKTILNNISNSVFGVTSDVLDKSNFNFHPLPSYVDLSLGLTSVGKNGSQEEKDKVIEEMFKPQPTSAAFESKYASGGPHFLCMYVGGYSKGLDLTSPKGNEGCIEEHSTNTGKVEFAGDGLTFSDPSDPNKISDKISSDYADESNGVVAFRVKFGSENQSHFLSVDLDQAEYKNTQESLIAIQRIADAGGPGGAQGFTTKGQSLYEVFLNRSYSCTVEAMGNMMIQPLQYFELEHVPMFYGSYLIRDVKHSVNPHDVKTTFTGDRIPQAVVPLVEDVISAFSLKPSSEVKGSIATNNTNSGGNGSSGSGGSGGSTRTGKAIDLSKLDASEDVGKIALYLSVAQQDGIGLLNPNNPFKVVPYYGVLSEGTFLNTEYPNQGEKWEEGGKEPVGITLHWTAGFDYKSAHNTLRNQDGNYNLSYHIVIGQDGVAYQFSDLNRSAAHAGCPPEKGPRCKGLNRGSVPTVAISYVGGVESGRATSGGDNVGYSRTWEQWQEEELTTPFCPKGTVRNKYGLYDCADNNDFGGKDKPISVGKTFKPAKQWDSLVNSILYAKLKWPSIRFITSHHFSSGGKVDVGDGFPWDKLIATLKERGWNKKDAGADPYIITEWVGKDGKIIKDNKLTISDDYLITSEEYSEYDGNEGDYDNRGAGEKTAQTAYRKNLGCVIDTIPQKANYLTDKQLFKLFKEERPNWNAATISGILGNIFRESRYNVNAYGTDKASCGSFGLVQWRSDKPGIGRQDKFGTFALEKVGSNAWTAAKLFYWDYAWAIPSIQVEYIIKELEASDDFDPLFEVPNTEEGTEKAAFIFASEFERCGECKNENTETIIGRKAKARELFNDLKSIDLSTISTANF